MKEVFFFPLTFDMSSLKHYFHFSSKVITKKNLRLPQPLPQFAKASQSKQSHQPCPKGKPTRPNPTCRIWGPFTSGTGSLGHGGSGGARTCGSGNSNGDISRFCSTSGRGPARESRATNTFCISGCFCIFFSTPLV